MPFSAALATGGGLAWQPVKSGLLRYCRLTYHGKGETAAKALSERAGGVAVQGADNPAAAALADIVVMTVPFANQMPTLETIREAVQGKVFVDATAPLVPPKVMRVQPPTGGSAGMIAQGISGRKCVGLSVSKRCRCNLQADEGHLMIAMCW